MFDRRLSKWKDRARLAAQRLVSEPAPSGGGKTSDTPEYLLDPSPPLECTEQEVNRWNREWLRYLGREWQTQLRPHTDYPGCPPLPDDPLALYGHKICEGTPGLSLYADREAIEERRIMEMGCGCGNLGKLISRYAREYLGTDYSTLALKIARLVSPDNCSYVHVADRVGLEPYFGTIETVVSRFFWIHQNEKLARNNLDFLSRFLEPGGLLYADFYWPNPEMKQGKVFHPGDPLSPEYPSATFKYDDNDVDRLLTGLPFSVEARVVAPEHQRRYVTLRRA